MKPLNIYLSLELPIFTAGLDVQYEPTNINFLTSQRDYDKFETTDEKFSVRRI